MATVTIRPESAYDSPATHPHLGIPPITPSIDADSRLAAAVREGATRATVAVGLCGLAAIHAVDAVGKWSETRYMFWMFIAAIAAALATAAWTIFTGSRTALLAAAGVTGSVLLG